MPWVGFKPTIPAFERANTVHALDRATTVTGRSVFVLQNILMYAAKDSPVPFSFLLNSLAVRMFANLLQEYTWRLLNHFSKLRLSNSNLAILCNHDDTITIRLGADFFNSPVIERLGYTYWIILDAMFVSLFGRVIVQAVSLRLPTAVASDRAQVRSCGICGGQNDIRAGFLRVLRLPLPILMPPTAPHKSYNIRGWYNRPVVADVPSGLKSHPTPRN
jgi:hypothetical protein